MLDFYSKKKNESLEHILQIKSSFKLPKNNGDILILKHVFYKI